MPPAAAPPAAPLAPRRPAVAWVRSLRLSTALLKKSVGKLGPTAGGVAFRRLAVQGMDLTDCELVRGYPALQTADLSRNRLECLAPLGSLPQLSTLIAKIDSLQNAMSSEFTSSIPRLSARDRLLMRKRMSRQPKSNAPVSIGPVSVGGAPLTAPATVAGPES